MVECPVCSWEFTREEIQEEASPELDSQLCRQHLREQLRMMREAR